MLTVTTRMTSRSRIGYVHRGRSAPLSVAPRSGEGLFDCLGDFVVGRQSARIPFGQDGAVAADQVLLEVPGDVAGDGFVGMRGEVSIERCLVVALHGNLGEQVERGLLLYTTEGLDLSVRAGLLFAEVVGGEGEYSQSLIFVLAVN
jgi:hypothetical protein